MTVNDQRATSFGSVAASYDRVRPGPAPDAVDWLVPAGCAVAVDLAAGTGLFTRALQSRAEHVVAVEPDRRMRDILAARSLKHAREVGDTVAAGHIWSQLTTMNPWREPTTCFAHQRRHGPVAHLCTTGLPKAAGLAK